MSKKLTAEQFIEKATLIHGDKYDYSKVEYINSKEKICVICKEHGDFYITPDNHINRKSGCPICAGVVISNTEDFIEKSKLIHGNKYDYSKVNYINNRNKICIICPVHGEFHQTPNNHLQGKGCIICAGINNGNTENFIEKATLIHGDKYDYSKTEYINTKEKICIICPIHGEFSQTPNNHINLKQGCPICAGVNNGNTENFIEKAKLVHGNKYNYSKVKYVNVKTKVCIICKEHGEFLQLPNAHTLLKQGCPKCVTISKLELEIEKELLNKNIKYISQYKPPFLRNGKSIQSIDFYLPKYKIGIECQGKQHFGLGGWSGKFNFKEQFERDEKKLKLCTENDIKLLYYSNIKYKNVINDIDELFGLINTSF